MPMRQKSLDASKTFDRPVELIFIDGLHEYESVKSDFEAWFPKLVTDGKIIFHDSVLMPGVKRLVSEVVRSGRVNNIGFVHSSTYATKTERATSLDRARNVFILALKRGYALSTKIYIPPMLKKALGYAGRMMFNRP